MGELSRHFFDPDNLGPQIQIFVRRYGAKIRQSCGKGGENIIRHPSKFKDSFKEILQDIESNRRGKRSGLLKDYSPWLALFHASNYDENVDIPGWQETSRVTISSFDPRVLVMKSLRAPKRITIIGSDYKEHKFLVKVWKRWSRFLRRL